MGDANQFLHTLGHSRRLPICAIELMEHVGNTVLVNSMVQSLLSRVLGPKGCPFVICVCLFFSTYAGDISLVEHSVHSLGRVISKWAFLSFFLSLVLGTPAISVKYRESAISSFRADIVDVARLLSEGHTTRTLYTIYCTFCSQSVPSSGHELHT